MTIAKLALMLVCLMSVTVEPKDAKVTPLLSKDLTDFPGKEGMLKNGSRTRRLWNSFYRVCVRLDSRILRSLNNTQAPGKRGKPRSSLYAWNLDPIFWITGGKSPLHSQPPESGRSHGGS